MKRRSTLPCLTIILSFFFLTNIAAQNIQQAEPHQSIGFCAQDYAHELAMKRNPQLFREQEDIEKRAYHFFQKKKMEKMLTDFTLPIVVHVIHNNGAENIPDPVVLQGIQDLNDAYANVGYYNPATGVDTRIQFCLAKRDPDGNATNGINRVQSTLTDMTLETDDITVKDLSRWDPLHYINIWLVKEICSSSYGCGVAGYAYFPSSHGAVNDGIMMEAAFFGSSQGASGVQVHEMGHYLGLYHTFQGGCTNNDCLADGDRVCDTPPDQSTAAVPCNGTANSCTTDTNSGFATDQNDLFEDYMDYGNFNCWSIFTQGQTDRMHWHIENVRFSLLESQGCQDPCTAALTSSFSSSTSTVNVGGSVNFTNNSTNTTSAEWTVDGVPFASTSDASYTFNQEGVFEICLEVGNADPNCSDKFCEEITVTCPVAALFSTAVFYPKPGEAVTYTNVSSNASSYEWKVNGTTVSTSQNLTWSFPDEQLYDLCLEASNGLCTQQYCLPVFVTSGVGGCDGSFLKYFGEAGQLETSNVLVATPDGNVLVGGQRGNESLLMLVTPDGDLLWERTFDLTNGDDFIQKMIIDSDGALVAIGRDVPNAATVNFIFRYDYQNDLMLWVKEFPQPAYSRFVNLMELPTDGNIILIGMVENPSTSLDNLVMKVDKNNGDQLWIKTYQAAGNTDISQGVKYRNGSLYLANVNRFGVALDKIRPTFSRLDAADGSQQWTRVYYTDPAGSARQYMVDLHLFGDAMIGAGHGDLSGSDVVDYSAQLVLATINGDVIWAKDYHFAGNTNSIFVSQLLPLPDGYIIQGNLNSFGANDVFFLRTDLNGNPMWAKSIGDGQAENANHAILHNGMVYFTGNTTNFDPSLDILFGSITLDGEVAGPGCEFARDLQVIYDDIPNPYDGQHNLTNISVDYGFDDNQLQAVSVNIPENDFPSCQCPISECDTTFLKTYGTIQDNEVVRAIAAVPAALGGGFLLGGGKADSAMITLLDPAGDIIWTRSFDATFDAADVIRDIRFDSDNMVIGVGNTRDEPLNNVECFAFRYNMVTNTMLWINELDLNDPANENYISILEKTPGGNYVVSGQTDDLISATGCDAILIELNRNTGFNVWQRNMTFGSCETFSKIITANGGIYATGRYNFDGSGTNRMRPGISKFDLNGNQLWTRFYIKGPSPEVARLYSTDILDDNGLLVFGQGDFDGTSADVNELFLLRTDYDGNVIWVKQYDIPGSSTERAAKVINLPDGYLCLGRHNSPDIDAFIFKTDKQGNLIWSKNYGEAGGDEDAWDMLWQAGQVYFTGTTTTPTSGISEDMYLTSISADGVVNAQDSCNLFTDLDMTQANWPNPYDGQHNLTDLNQNWFQFLGTAQMGETAVQTTVECFIPCLDSCDLVPEVLVQSVTATCAGPGLIVDLEICNTGNFDLPANTPVTIYDGDPTAGNATAVITIVLPSTVGHGACDTFLLTFFGQPNTTYFILVNDDGTTPTPFDLTTFEGDTDECDYTNNIGSLRYDYTAPVLDLGPDTAMCQFGVVDLDSGPGFASYLWQDGTTEQTLTAFAPGTYSVMVTDSCGGVQTDSITISIDPTTVLDLGPDVAVCQGGSHTFNVTGFATYEWLPSDYLDCTDCPNPTTTPQADITYTLIATNADGCISVDSVVVSVAPGFDVTDSIEICSGDTAIVFGNPVDTAGVFTETFTSTGGCDSTVTIVVTVLPSIHVIADAVICEGDTILVFGMPVFEAGEFTQTYTAQNGCDSTFTIAVGVFENVFTEETISICFGDTVEIFGTPTSTAGVYEMTFAGSNSCDSTHTITLEVNDEIMIDFQKTDVNCFGGIDGSVTAVASGGSGGFTYVWEDGSTDPDRTGMPAGMYSVVATDSSGCSAEASVTISEPAEIELMVAGLFTPCSEFGGAAVDAMGGKGDFTYLWSNGETTMAILGVPEGTYAVTATDENSCTATDFVLVETMPGPNVDIVVDQQISVNDPNSGQLTANVSGGTAPFDYDWSNGETTATIDSLPSGQYFVTVTDANGCTAVDSVQLFLAACTGGKIWKDLDRDGCQDGGETGFANVTLTLSGTDIFGNVVTATTTSALNGEYIFENLAPGDYQVHINVPTGYTLSPPNACSDDFTDSDFNSSGNSYVIELTEGHCCLIVDGGLYESCLNVTDPGTICCDQVLCGPGNDPAPITTISPATGANSIQYMWLWSHVQDPPSTGNPAWHTVVDAFGNAVMTANYDPGPLSETTYFARCVKSATCNTWLETNVVEITVEDDAVAAINEPGAICVGDEITFTAAPNGPNATYFWNFGPYATPSTSTAQSPTVVWSQAGYLSISLTVTDNDCVSKDVQLIAVSDNPVYCGMAIIAPNNNHGTGLQVAGLANRLEVFPNPVGDILNIGWENELGLETTIEVLSITGQQLRRLQLPAKTHSTQMDVSDLEAGVYLLKVRLGDGEVSVVRVVKG